MNRHAPVTWWENFFHGIALDFWRVVITEEQTRAETDFIQKQLGLQAGAKVLDVPCGNGRLSIELAKRGFDLTGVDIAPEFIAEAKAKTSELGLSVEWQNGDMRELTWIDTFDGAFCFGNSFGYLCEEENAEFLTAVARSLKVGAHFILDAPAIAETLLPVNQEQRRFEVGDITLLVDHWYDEGQSRMFTDYTFIRDGRADKRPASQRIYSCSELRKLLESAGLKIISEYGALDEQPFKSGSQRLLLVCEKQGQYS